MPAVNVYLPKDRVTNAHQGYGFVEFRGEEDADYVGTGGHDMERKAAVTASDWFCRTAREQYVNLQSSRGLRSYVRSSCNQHDHIAEGVARLLNVGILYLYLYRYSYIE